MAQEKTTISIDGVITKNDSTPISEKEYDIIWDEILEVIVKHNCSFGGGTGLHTDNEIMEILNEK